MVDWELKCQKKQTQINKYKIRKNSKIVDHDYKFGEKVMLTNNAAFKYENPYKGSIQITQCRTNGTVTLHFVVTKIRYNICRIKSYTYDTNVEDITAENYV